MPQYWVSIILFYTYIGLCLQDLNKEFLGEIAEAELPLTVIQMKYVLQRKISELVCTKNIWKHGAQGRAYESGTCTSLYVQPHHWQFSWMETSYLIYQSSVHILVKQNFYIAQELGHHHCLLKLKIFCIHMIIFIAIHFSLLCIQIFKYIYIYHCNIYKFISKLFMDYL